MSAVEPHAQTARNFVGGFTGFPRNPLRLGYFRAAPLGQAFQTWRVGNSCRLDVARVGGGDIQRSGLVGVESLPSFDARY